MDTVKMGLTCSSPFPYLHLSVHCLFLSVRWWPTKFQNIKYKEKAQRMAAHERKLQKRRDRKARDLALFATWRGEEAGVGKGVEADAIRS